MAGLLSDELSKQMDADLFGEPKKSSLDPKLSEEMDKELGLSPSRPWAGAIKPPEPEEPGYLGALGKGIYTGFRRRLPEQIGQAIQFTGIAPETGKAIAQLGTEGEVRPEFKNPIKQVLYEGGEMLAPSMAIPAALGAAGVGAIPASVATAALFGLSQAQATKEEAEKRGVEPGAAPYATGTIEALGEAAGTYYLTRLLGPLAPLFKAGTKTTAREVIKPTLGRLIKEFPKTLAVEAGTEFGQQAGEAAVEKYAGIRPEAEPLKEGLGVIGPTAVLTGLTMGAAHPFSRIQGMKLEKILTDPKIDPETREAAVNAVSSYMEEADKNISERWKQKALETVKQGQPIPMEEDIYEWIGLKPKQAIPTEPKTEETGAIPIQPKGYDLITKKSEEPEGPPAAPSGAIPQPEKTTAEEAMDLLQTFQKVPGAGKPAPAIPEAAAYTEEQVQAALGGMEQPKAAIPAKEKPEAPKGAIPAIEQGEKENLEKIRALNENTERLIREGGYEVAKRQPRSREGEAALLKHGYVPMLWNPQTGQLEKNVLGEWVRKKGEGAKPAAAIPLAAEEEEKGKEPWEMTRNDFIADRQAKGITTKKRENVDIAKILHETLIKAALSEGKPVSPEVLKDYPELQPKQAIPIPTKIEEAAAEAATSPANKLPEPTEAQKEAGNYQKGHVDLHGMDISIENPRGSTRSGVSPEGKKWETTLAHHYGYIRGTKGKDKDHLDVFIGPHPDSEFVTVIDQVDPKTGKFDEHKIMLGFQNLAEGQVGYLANYEPGWKGLGAAKGFDILEFKDWLKEGDTTKPIAMKGAIPFAERRKDLEKRKRLAEMTPEEMKEELLTDPLTGLGNRRAYEESPRLPIQAMIDVDSLKAVNDTMGHEAGDELLKAVGNSLRNLLASRAYHTSGDEFIVEGPTRELVENQLRGIREELAGAEIEATAPDGTKYQYKGLEISYGIGTNLKEADDALSREKQERERKGLRAPRGERPKGLAAIPAPGVQTEGEAPAGEIEEPKTLPANWIDAGWKIQDRGALQIAISPEGKEYTLWGQRLEPIKEPEKVIPAAKKEAEPEERITEPAAEEAEEEEVTPRSIPFEAVKYANAIKNKLKKNYAWSYLKWKTGKTEEKPDPKGLSTLAAQIVRISVNKILGEPYKFKPQVGEAKTDEKDNIEIPDLRTGKTEEGAFERKTARLGTPEREAFAARFKEHEAQRDKLLDDLSEAKKKRDAAPSYSKKRELIQKKVDRLQGQYDQLVKSPLEEEDLRARWEDFAETGDPIQKLEAKHRLKLITSQELEKAEKEIFQKEIEKRGVGEDEMKPMITEAWLASFKMSDGLEKTIDISIARIRAPELKEEARRKITAMNLGEKEKSGYLQSVNNTSIWPEDINRIMEQAKQEEKDNPVTAPAGKEEGAKPKEKEPASEYGEELKLWDAWREQPRKEISIEPEKIGKVETPKEQKKYLIDAIDEAVGQAPEKWIEGEYVLIEVPNDGTFRIKNEIATLQAFKKKAQTIEAGKEDQPPKRPPAMRAARGRLSGEGVEYYNEFKPRGKGIYLDPSKYQYGSGFYTNGVYMVKTEKPEVPPKAQVLREGKQSDESVSTLLADFASKSKEPAQIVGEFHLGTNENEIPKADLIDKKGRHVPADAKLIDSVLAKHPEAKPFVNGKEPQISPIVFKKGDEIVGVVMPMRLDQNEQNFVKEGAKRVLGETEGAAKPKTAKQTEKQPAGETIGDFGKKIGGARKDLWKERGLSIADVAGMTRQERETYTKKAHIWPSADYERFVKDGMPPEVAYLVKRVKDAIAVEPDLPTSAKSSPELREKNFRRYIELVSALRDRLPKVRTPEDIRAIKTELFPTEPTGGISGANRYTKESNADLLLLGGKSVSDALQPRSIHIMDAKDKVKKTGFPAKQEAWQRQYDVHFTKAGSKVFREGKETTTEKDEWFITKKDKHFILQDGFSSREEAEAWAKDQSKATGERLTRPFRENIERTGADYRKGRNITGDEILAEFGFRGGEFGNWTNQEDRKQALNEAYDGLRDLADALKVPPKALSLNGELGIAFGARGGGSASAHYEPGRVVINLTKTRGAGSLAHEWAHAVDDYFGRMATGGIPGKYISHGERGAKESGKVRPEMLQAWAGVMKAISDRVADKERSLAFAQKGVKQMTSYVNSWLRGLNEFIKNNPEAKADTVNELVAMLRGEKPKQWNGEKIGPQETAAHLRQEADQIGYKMAADDSKKIGINAWHLERAQVDLAKAEAGELTRGEKTDFLKNAMERGSGKGDNYWARKHELFARAFESFVEDRIEESGNKSEYLVHSTKESPTSPWGQIYPQGRDRAAINAVFEKWVQTLKTKEEGSHTVLFKLEEGRLFGPSMDELLAKPNVPVVEVKSKFKGKFKEARVWALSNLRGEPVKNKDTGMKIGIGRDAIEKATTASAVKESGRTEHLEAIQKLRKLLENAILAESHPDREKDINIKAIHRFFAPISIDGKLFSAKLTVKEYLRRPTGYYTHELIKIEMPARKLLGGIPKEVAANTQAGIYEISIADLLKNARRNDGTPFIPSAPETSLKPAEGRGEIKPEIIPATAATPEELREIEETIRKIAPGEVSFKQALYLDMRKEKHQAALLKHGYSERDLARIIADGNVYFKVAGRMTPVRFGQGPWEAIINVATGGKDALQIKGDALHEAFEAVRSFMLTDEEVKILDARYPGKEGLSANEVQADAFADWVKNEKRPVPRSAKSIFEKIAQFFERLSNFFGGLGFKTAEDIFEAASEGGIRERYEVGGREAAPETAFKMEPVEQAEVKEALAHPEASVMEAVQEKQHLKSLIRAEIEGEEIPEGSAVRFADAGYIKSVLRQGRLPEGGSFEGRAGISATRVKRGITPVAYGSNYKHSAAITIPKEYIRGTGNAPNEVLIDPKVPLDRLRFYIDGQDRSFSIDELREAGEFREERVPAFKLEGPIRNIIDSLKSPDLPAEAEQDKGFKDSIKKTRLGLVKVTDNDLKLWERALSLPFWLQDKYKELRPLVHTQMKREENRSETIHGLLNRARPFFALKGEEMAKVEKAMVQGDREGKVYEEKELREKFNLGSEGIEGYRAVRKTLNWIHAEWKARIEENVLREYEKEKWFTLFKAAHGLEFSDEETLALDKALKRTRKAMEKPVETVRAHLQRVFEEEFSPRNKQLLADLLGDYMRAYRRARKQIDKIKEIVRDAIGEGMSEEDLNKNTQALVQAYIRSLPAMQQLKELRSELNKIGGYFPRSRKMGKYRVVVTDSFEDAFGNKEKQTVYYQNAANRLEATKIHDKIKADPEYKDMEIAVEPVRQEAETTFMGASAINMQRLVDNAIDKLRAQGDLPVEIAGLIRMNVLETLADELKARGAGRFAIRRADNIIEGYQKTNLKEVLKDYIDGWSGMITKQEAALEFLDELKQIPRNKPQVMAYGSKYAQDMLRNQEPMDRISAKMRSLAFLYFLGGSLRAAAVNFTQNYVTGIPFLAREVGAKTLKAEKIYHKAMFDVAVGKNLNEVEKRMLDEMINKGVAEDQFIRQIHREVKGALGQWTGKVVDILAKPFSWMEKLNRKSAALSMFRVKMEKFKAQGIDAEEAYRKSFSYSQDFVYKTHYLMTKANLPSMAAGGDVGAQFLKTAYTFRRFTHNYLLSLHHSMKGPEGGLALDVMARSLAYVVLLAGIPAIPFLDDLLDEWEKFFGTPVRSNMRKTLREAGGPVLERLGMAGIPALVGIDISGSLKMGIPLVGAGTPQDTIYGVYGGMAKKALNAMSAVEREDYLRALEFASLAFIKAVLKAYRMSDVGLTTPRGKIITDEQGRPIRLGAGEGVAQAAGFRPERVARISGEHWTMENVQRYFKEKRDNLYSRYRLAKTPEDKKKVLRDMQRFNLDSRKYRGVIPPITATSLRQTAMQKPEKAFLSFGKIAEGNFDSNNVRSA